MTSSRDGDAFYDDYWRLPGKPVDHLPTLDATPGDSEFRRFADCQPTLCWIADGSGYIYWYNRSWHQYCGTTAADMEGWGWTSVHDPAVLPEVQDRWRASVAAGEPFEMTFPLRGADGIFRPFLTRICPLYDSSGKPVRWYGNNVDITQQQTLELEYRRSQERLKELNDTLELRVLERTEGLRQAEEQLRQSQKLEAIGQLTGGVAHDFNNLLTVIKGSVELLRRPNLSEDRRERCITAIEDTAERAAKLTGQLLAFARRQSLTPEVFDLGKALVGLRGMLGSLIGSRITLRQCLPDAACFTTADRNQFDTAIVNMVINARDALRSEGLITIGMHPVDGIPSIRSHPPVAGDFLAVSIADTGSGIAPDQLDHIFEPFFTTKDVGAGTGLGLSQVYGFAKQSKGDIRVESTPGAGTMFTLYLQRCDSETRLAEIPAVPAEAAAGHGVCVLVVEDNEDVGRFATDALEELGYDSRLAIDGPQALDELAHNPGRFHVVFSDVVMPGMSGVELGEEINRRYPGIPVILSSGYSHVLAQDSSHRFELLHKPYSIDQLSRVMGKALKAT